LRSGRREDIMPHAHIIVTGATAPKRILTNEELEKIVDTSDEWITQRTGIKERHISLNGGEETTTHLAAGAALKAMNMAGVGPDNLDLIVVATVTADRQFPSAACSVQNVLGNRKAAAFDISAGCSGFLYALSMADNAIRSKASNTALVIGAERLSSVINWEDRNTCVLLGDGAGAVVLASRRNSDGILSTHLRSDGAAWNLLYASEGSSYTPEILNGLDRKSFHLRMEGPKLFKKAVECLTSIACDALERNSLSSKDISLVVPHQANIRIIQVLAEKLNLPMEKVFTNLERYGNTSSASIPIALDEANRAGLIQKGDNVLLVSFGSGLTWASSILRWSA
jgi:3-oxoacyl-[acyl-carrier-protein] synthase-3